MLLQIFVGIPAMIGFYFFVRWLIIGISETFGAGVFGGMLAFIFLLLFFGHQSLKGWYPKFCAIALSSFGIYLFAEAYANHLLTDYGKGFATGFILFGLLMWTVWKNDPDSFRPAAR